jgi:hypothetical protein
METPAATDPPAPDPELIEKFAKQALDLDALRKTVEDAAAVSAGFWLSYLFVLFYIGIAAGGVTHKDLLLENPVKLPFLNVELPLVAFFCFGADSVHRLACLYACAFRHASCEDGRL